MQLSDPVTEKELSDIAHGKAPNGIKIKRKQTKKVGDERVSAHVAGNDLTFSIDKSWSIIGLVGGDKRVVEAFRFSCAEALEEIERTCTEAQIRTKGERRREITGNLIAATFDHETSRPSGNHPPQPLIHRHTIVFNSTQCSDRKWRRLETEQYFSKQKPRIVEFFADRFLERVHELGYETEWNADGKTFKCAQITREQIEAFSPRSQQVQKEVQRLADSPMHSLKDGKPSSRQIRYAALNNRAKKWDVPTAELIPIWEEKASDLGIDFDSIPGFVRTPAEIHLSTEEIRELTIARLNTLGNDGLSLNDEPGIFVSDAEAMEWIRPQHIAEDHWKELVIDSGIHPAIASQTFRTVDGREAEKLILGYKLDQIEKYGGTYKAKQIKKLKKAYKHLRQGGLWCQGADNWGQLKPREQRIRNGKPLKYESPLGPPAGITLPQGPDLNWDEIAKDPSIAIGITEGGKKACCGTSHGLPMVGIAGLTLGLEKTDLRGPLKNFVWEGRKVFIVLDKDPSKKLRTLQDAARELYKMGAVYEFYGADVSLGTLPGKLTEKVGLDDYFVAGRTWDDIKIQSVDEFAKASPYLAKKWKAHNLKRIKHQLRASDLEIEPRVKQPSGPKAQQLKVKRIGEPSKDSDLER